MVSGLRCTSSVICPPCTCRYVVAHTSDAMYVAFLGTKQPIDHLVNLSWWLQPVWTGSSARAHAGYLKRSALVPIHRLHSMALKSQKRLVLSGRHSGVRFLLVFMECKFQHVCFSPRYCSDSEASPVKMMCLLRMRRPFSRRGCCGAVHAAPAPHARPGDCELHRICHTTSGRPLPLATHS